MTEAFMSSSDSDAATCAPTPTEKCDPAKPKEADQEQDVVEETDLDSEKDIETPSAETGTDGLTGGGKNDIQQLLSNSGKKRRGKDLRPRKRRSYKELQKEQIPSFRCRYPNCDRKYVGQYGRFNLQRHVRAKHGDQPEIAIDQMIDEQPGQRSREMDGYYPPHLAMTANMLPSASSFHAIGMDVREAQASHLALLQPDPLAGLGRFGRYALNGAMLPNSNLMREQHKWRQIQSWHCLSGVSLPQLTEHWGIGDVGSRGQEFTGDVMRNSHVREHMQPSPQLVCK